MVDNKEIIGWDDELEMGEGPHFVLLVPGDYNFEVSEFKRGETSGDGKLGKVPQAELKLKVESENGTATIDYKLQMVKSLQWKLDAFARSINIKADENGSYKIPWKNLIGMKGRARFKNKPFTGRDGEERNTNEVDYMIDYDPEFFKQKKKKTMEEFDPKTDDELPF